MSLFSRITGMFCRASQPDIEDDDLDEEWDDEELDDDLRICYPDTFDPLSEGDFD